MEPKRKLYLLNALITPYEPKREDEFAIFSVQRVNLEKFKEILESALNEDFEIVSAIRHKGTIEFLKEILPEKFHPYLVPNNQYIFFEEGDIGLAFRLNIRDQRLEEKTYEEVKKLYNEGKTEFLFLSRTIAPEIVFNPAYILGKEE